VLVGTRQSDFVQTPETQTISGPRRRVREAVASCIGTSEAETPDQRRRDEKDYRRNQKARELAKGSCEVSPGERQ
jgi:hypothetical protein